MIASANGVQPTSAPPSVAPAAPIVTVAMSGKVWMRGRDIRNSVSKPNIPAKAGFDRRRRPSLPNTATASER